MTALLALRQPVYSHLRTLTDEQGVFEHALFDVPRPEHGYCVDDAARALLVSVRERARTPALDQVGSVCLRFVESALDPSGSSRNRMDITGRWTDEPSLGDWWGRSLWGLGTAAARASRAGVRRRAMRSFRSAARRRSPHLHAMAFAALGGSELLRAGRGDDQTRALVRDAVDFILSTKSALWDWPEDRLRYSSGSIAEAVIAGGAALGDPEALETGLRMLEFLVATQTVGDRLSVVGMSGRAPGERGPQFDQQPIEVAAIADAAARAYDVTGDPSWLVPVNRAWAWFEGDNDTRVLMYDPATGAGYDGLTSSGRNENRGAESTLAVLSTWQQARRLTLVEERS